MGVRNRVCNVGCEVLDLTSASRSLQVIIDPTNQNLLRGKFHEFFESFTLHQKCCQARICTKVNIREKTILKVQKKYSDGTSDHLNSCLTIFSQCNNLLVQNYLFSNTFHCMKKVYEK